MTFKTYRNLSRIDWGHEADKPTLEQINCGALLRIADASELMAKNHAELVASRDRYKRYYEEERQAAQRLQRQVSALRGQITKLKKPKQ